MESALLLLALKQAPRMRPPDLRMNIFGADCMGHWRIHAPENIPLTDSKLDKLLVFPLFFSLLASLNKD